LKAEHNITIIKKMELKMKKILIIILTFISLLLSQDQMYIDSLKNELPKIYGEDKIDNYLVLASYLANYNPEEAIKIAKEGIKLSKENNSYKLGLLYYEIDLNFSALTLYDSAYYYSSKSKDYYISQNDSLGLLYAINSIGIYYNKTNQLDKAIQTFTELKEIAISQNSTQHLGTAYINLGIIDLNQGRYSEALEKYLKALNIDEKDKNKYRKTNTYVNLGSLLGITNNYEKSTEYFFKAKHLAEEAKDYYHLWFIHNNLSFLYQKQKDYPKAIEQAEKSIEIAKISNNNLNLVFSLLSKLQYLIEYDKFSNVDSLFMSINQLLVNVNSKDAESYVYDLKCDYEIKMGNYNKALTYHNKMMKINETINYAPDSKINHAIRLGNIYTKLDKKNEGIALIQNAILEADNLELIDLKKNAYENLYKIYKDELNYKNALEYLKLYTDFSDSLYHLQKKSNIEELEIIHKIEQKNKETEILKKENEIAEDQLSNQKYIITSGIFIIILSLGILLIFMKFYLSKRKINKQLQKQYSIIEEQKNELEKSVASKDKLYSIIGHDLFNAHSNISSFINILKRTINNLDPKFIEKLTTELETINNNSLQLLDTLVEWGEIQTKKKTFSPSSFNLKAMAYNNLLLFKKNIEEKSIQIDNKIANDTEIFADKGLLGTVLRNIISNSIKFVNYGGTLEVNDSKENGRININIIDNGIGIHEHNLNLLFKIEETITTKGTSGEKGHGLGLIICKEMMDLHNGNINIQSTVDVGTTITLTLPNDKPLD